MSFIKPFVRSFIPAKFSVKTWDDVKPYADALLSRELDSLAAFEQFLKDWDELSVVLGEDYIKRMVATTLDTTDTEAEKAYNDYVSLIDSEMMKVNDTLRRRAVASPYISQFNQDGFPLLRKQWSWALELFREANIPFQTEEGIKSQKSSQIKGGMNVTLDGETMTLQKAATRFEWTDRAKREEAWHAVRGRMLQDKKDLDDNISELIVIRDTMAKNAGFENFRDYKFKDLQRFDYGPKECFTFHDAIEKEVLPLIDVMDKKRIKDMGLAAMRPWDGVCDPFGREPLKAFEMADELITKSVSALDALDPVLGDTLKRMQSFKTLDIASRPNKRPGAYNVYLYETRTSFMFGNVTGMVDDMATFMHEAGHAAHDYLCSNLPLSFYHSYPMEIAELASMSLELLSFDHWHKFFPNEADCNRARYDHLDGIVRFFPHMARIDAFQHALYEKPNMNPEQRHDAFDALQKRFGSSHVDWKGLEEFRRTAWHWQLHIFEIPFYYVEYGIAQMGALQMWRNYKQDKKQALAQYKAALSLGYTRPLPELYATAGIKLDFSAPMLKELMAFVQKEMAALV